MLPESLIGTRVADPVCIHVGEEGSLAGGGQDSGDIGVGARRIAIGVEGSITVVWPIACQKERRHGRGVQGLPQAVNGPGIDWSSGRVGVPELSLEVEGEQVGEKAMHLGVPAAAARPGR